MEARRLAYWTVRMALATTQVPASEAATTVGIKALEAYLKAKPHSRAACWFHRATPLEVWKVIKGVVEEARVRTPVAVLVE